MDADQRDSLETLLVERAWNEIRSLIKTSNGTRANKNDAKRFRESVEVISRIRPGFLSDGVDELTQSSSPAVVDAIVAALPDLLREEGAIAKLNSLLTNPTRDAENSDLLGLTEKPIALQETLRTGEFERLFYGRARWLGGDDEAPLSDLIELLQRAKDNDISMRTVLRVFVENASEFGEQEAMQWAHQALTAVRLAGGRSLHETANLASRGDADSVQRLRTLIIDTTPPGPDLLSISNDRERITTVMLQCARHLDSTVSVPALEALIALRHPEASSSALAIVQKFTAEIQASAVVNLGPLNSMPERIAIQALVKTNTSRDIAALVHLAHALEVKDHSGILIETLRRIGGPATDALEAFALDERLSFLTRWRALRAADEHAIRRVRLFERAPVVVVNSTQQLAIDNQKRAIEAMADQAWPRLQEFLDQPYEITPASNEATLFHDYMAMVARFRPKHLRPHVDELLQSPNEDVVHAVVAVLPHLLSEEDALAKLEELLDNPTGGATNARLWIAESVGRWRLPTGYLWVAQQVSKDDSRIVVDKSAPWNFMRHGRSAITDDYVRSLEDLAEFDPGAQLLLDWQRITGQVSPFGQSTYNPKASNMAVHMRDARRLGADVDAPVSELITLMKKTSSAFLDVRVPLQAFVESGTQAGERGTTRRAQHAVEIMYLPKEFDLDTTIANAALGNEYCVKHLATFVRHSTPPGPDLLADHPRRADIVEAMIRNAERFHSDLMEHHVGLAAGHVKMAALKTLDALQDPSAVPLAVDDLLDKANQLLNTHPGGQIVNGTEHVAVGIVVAADTAECRQALQTFADALETHGRSDAIVNMLDHIGGLSAMRALGAVAANPQLSVTTRWNAFTTAERIARHTAQRRQATITTYALPNDVPEDNEATVKGHRQPVRPVSSPIEIEAVSDEDAHPPEHSTPRSRMSSSNGKDSSKTNPPDDSPPFP